MDLGVDGSAVTGTYWTAVGNAQGQYALSGATDPTPLPYGQAVAWAVAWVNQNGDSYSVTSWSGQYQEIDGEEVLTAMWLLTIETDSSNDWASTLVGQDVFTRQQPTAEAIARRLKAGRPSHPM